MKQAVLLTLLTLALCLSAAAQNTVEVFDRYVESARRSWDIPGLSVVAVQDGKVVFAKGYGVRELGKNEPVDTTTLFGTMSTTKAMTAVAMGLLVDEGKVAWRDKVTKHLPDFRIDDPYITANLEVRDLFTHNTGLSSTDFLWARTPDLPADEALRRMQYAKPSYPFRAGFQYHNSMYLVAGEVIEKASGMPWAQFVAERVFRPLGMSNTLPTLASALKAANRSSAHFKIKGKVERIDEMPIDPVAPAGAVWSNAEDMGKWMTYLLSGKTPGGKDLLKPETLDELFKPQVMLPPRYYPTFQVLKPKFTTYGLGWFQHDYRAEKVDLHTGSIDGRIALVGLLRDKKFGVYVFGNLDHAEARHGIIYKAFDVFAFNEPNGRDWNAEFKTIYDASAAELEKRIASQVNAKLPESKPSLPLAAYTGTYSDPFYGTVEVTLSGDKLKATFAKDAWFDLQHRQNDTFLAIANKAWRGPTLATFNLDPQKREVVTVTAGGQTFKRQAK